MTDTYLDPSAAAGDAVQSLARLVVAVALPALMDELTQQAEQFNRTIAIMQETIGNQSRRMTGHGLQLKELRKTVERQARELELQRIERERLEMRLNLTTVKTNRMEGLISEDRRYMAQIKEVVNANGDYVAELEQRVDTALTELESRTADLEAKAWPQPVAFVEGNPIANLDDAGLLVFLESGKLPAFASRPSCDEAGHCLRCQAEQARACCHCGEILR